MAIMNEGLLQKTFVCGAAVAANRIVKGGADDTKVVVGAAASDATFGLSGNLAGATGDHIDVILEGIGLCKCGGTILIGEMVTSDGTGQGVATSTAGARIIGVAIEGGVSGDLIGVLINPGSV